MTDVIQALQELATVNLFSDGRAPETFIGRPFHFDYTTVKVLVNDKWKAANRGIPAGALLLCFSDVEEEVEEAILLRVIEPTSLPTDSEMVQSMVEFYKESPPAMETTTKTLDTYTRYEFGFSGLQCRVLGTFFKGKDDNGHEQVLFGADLENFFGATHYEVFKPREKVLEYIVNFREGQGISGGEGDTKLGFVRYSASRRLDPIDKAKSAKIFVSTLDFVGKRTALFGMTRTGKSNTVKKILESIVELTSTPGATDSGGDPLDPVGQIIFDINGEYANANLQDDGTAIYEKFQDSTTRYSLLEKDGFHVMRLNFHSNIESGFGMIQSFLQDQDMKYAQNFLAIDMSPAPEGDYSAMTRKGRTRAAYRACLHAAEFDMGPEPITFTVNSELNEMIDLGDPAAGLTGDEAVAWFTKLWSIYPAYNTEYLQSHPSGWADEDLLAALAMLTRTQKPGETNKNHNGYRLLRPYRKYHTGLVTTSFEVDIVNALRIGRIVIIDLSQGDPNIQRTYSERICWRIFKNAVEGFINNLNQNYIQAYFEEAHNLFPKKDDQDLSQVYNRWAKEGAKLRLGLVYATQEVSSISSNILKNTQNWFVSHLNNTDELQEIKKYYDFEDFIHSLQRTSDKGFIRMKTFSNAFVVPVQIDRFAAEAEDD